MSYPRALDEYASEELVDEIMRRQARRHSQRCDYCDRLPGTDACKFPDRHNLSTVAPATLFADAFGRLRADQMARGIV